MNFNEFLPFIIPLITIQICLQIYTIYQIIKYPCYKCGNKVLWIFIVCIFSYLGVITYFVIGKGE